MKEIKSLNDLKENESGTLQIGKKGYYVTRLNDEDENNKYIRSDKH